MAEERNFKLEHWLCDLADIHHDFWMAEWQVIMLKAIFAIWEGKLNTSNRSVDISLNCDGITAQIAEIEASNITRIEWPWEKNERKFVIMYQALKDLYNKYGDKK